MSAHGNSAWVLLVVEFLDEFIYGAREAAWPLVRSDLALTYAQIGVLLGLPRVLSGIVEPFLGILGDIWRRRALILAGGVVFAISLLLTAVSQSYAWLLISFALFSPASGAFVSLSQATLMDLQPARREQAMARWTFAGSLGVVLGPIALGLLLAGSLGWRTVFIAAATLTVVVLILMWRLRFLTPAGTEGNVSLLAGAREALRALRRREVLRWLVLLQFSDLMLDVLLGFLALYFVDVAGVSTARASTAVAAWTAAGLVSDLLLIRLLDRVDGLAYLRVSAVAELALFATLLLISSFWAKLVILALLGVFNAGWYAILKARLYATVPGKSGTVMAVDNIFGLVGGLLPWGIGVVAESFGLGAAMWLLCAGPLALLVGLPQRGAPGSGISPEIG